MITIWENGLKMVMFIIVTFIIFKFKLSILCLQRMLRYDGLKYGILYGYFSWPARWSITLTGQMNNDAGFGGRSGDYPREPVTRTVRGLARLP